MASSPTLPPTMAGDPSPVPDADLLPAQTYEELGSLGKGGSAVVLRVRDNRLDREVALKRLDGNQHFQPHLVEGFLAEARLTSQLEHPGIVPVHAVGVNEVGEPFFTMKVVEGLTLSKWLPARDRIDPRAAVLADALEIFVKVCDAASYAHSRGFVHCDIKPGNIMIGQHGEVYLMDWGIAMPVGTPIRFAGTPGFMAPEVVTGGTLSPAVDVFALGAVLYYILARRSPYSAKAVNDVLDQARRGDWTDINSLGLERPPPHAIVDIVRRALARNPAERYADGRELGRAVRNVVRRGLHLPERTYPAGTVLMREGDAGNEAFIVLAGTARASRVVNGRTVHLRDMGPGEIFGEFAILSDRPRSADVEALTDLAVLVVTRDILESELGLHTWVGTLVRTMAARFRELEARLPAG